MRYVLQLLVVLQVNLLYSQVTAQFSPVGAEWHIGFNVSGIIPSRGFNHYRYIGDTLIQGKTAKALHIEQVLFPLSGPNIPTDTFDLGQEYFLQSGDSVFVWRYDAFKFLWRTNVVAGQKFSVEKITGIYYEMKVDSVKTLQMNGQNVKKIWITGSSNVGIGGGKAVIYDKFGPENGFTYFSCWGAYDCFDPSLCRYRDDLFSPVEFPSPHCLVLTNASEPEFLPAQMTIFPNPASNTVSIELHNQVEVEHIWVFNVSGSMVLSLNQPLAHRIELDVSHLPSGTYILKLMTGRQLASGRFFKQ